MEKNKLDRNSEEYRGLFSRYLARGHNGLTDVEARALSEGSATGGAVLFPTTYSNMFMSEMGDDRIVGQVSKVYTSTGTFSVPIITPTGSAGFSVQKNPGEAGTLLDATAGSQTTVTVPSFTQPGTSNTGSSTSTFTLKRISVMVRASRELVEDSASQGDASVENIIVKQASQDLNRELSRQILIGNKDDSVTAGTASTAGSDACHGIVNTLKRYSRSITTTAALGGDYGVITQSSNGILNATLGLVQNSRLTSAYFERATWIFNSQLNVHPTASSQGAGIVPSAQSQVALWSERRLFGQPWLFAEMSPASNTSVPAAGEPLVVAADLSRYMLALAGNGISVTRLNETYAATNEVAFIVSVRCAGALTDVNAAFGIHRG
jgi:HK97 family phage major capsid protein